jgi:hypothetical protein
MTKHYCAGKSRATSLGPLTEVKVDEDKFKISLDLASLEIQGCKESIVVMPMRCVGSIVNDETLERIYLGRRFKNDTERLEKLFELDPQMTAKAPAAKKAAKPAKGRKA